jgi:uncharacterized membrane protein (UPF0127 family)
MMRLLGEYTREIMTSQVNPGYLDLSIRGRRINAEVATTTETRNRGLMHRDSLDENGGMLFVFPDTDYRSFWMESTYIPLSIAYLTEAGTIINIERMHPHNRTSVRSSAPAKYALEVNAGWFKKNRIRPGDTVDGLPNFTEATIREAIVLLEDAEPNVLMRDVDDILDDAILSAAPEIVRDIREREVDEDIDEFIDGALHGDWDSKQQDYADPPAVGDPVEVMDAGDTEEVTEMYRLGYNWGWSNPGKLQDAQNIPTGIRAEMVEYALENFKSRVTEEFVVDALEKTVGYVKKQMGDVHHLLKKAKEKFGWKVAPAIVSIEVIEHAILPTALGAIHPIFYGLAAVPTVEILAATALAIAKARMPPEEVRELPPGHLDWYEDEYNKRAANESALREYVRTLLIEQSR